MQDPLQIFKTRRSAEMMLRNGDVDAARATLQVNATNEVAALAAVDQYESAPRKSPTVGGLLGIFPGAGYWYSGEIANGFRSLILNSLFMYGMYGTAEENLWGAFGVITFFEATWYSGSIYGGVGAAHRYNKRQLEQCVDELDVPDVQPSHNVTIPLFQLKVEF
ncbi:MAG: hypothetical protein FJ220_03135 [Kiritimatiellaceae bacterium]|nr:hypothetical protein [Kiritimatiellaceae bacterium]